MHSRISKEKLRCSQSVWQKIEALLGISVYLIRMTLHLRKRTELQNSFLGRYLRISSSLHLSCPSSRGPSLWQQSRPYLCFHFSEVEEGRLSSRQENPSQCSLRHSSRKDQTQGKGNSWSKPWLCHSKVIVTLNPECVKLQKKRKNTTMMFLN